MTIECGESLNFRVTAVTDTILTSSSDRTRRKCIYLECTDDSFANDVWVEGIGSLRFGIEGNLALAVGSKATLIKCTSDEEVLYLNPNQEWDHEYVPFVEEGKVWYCKDGQITPEDPWGSDIDCIFTIQGDTLIGENIYKKVFCQYENYYGDKDQHYYCAVREESYQVFLVEEEANEEILLYDFSQPRKTIAFERNKLRFARCAGDHIDEIIWQTHQYDFWLAAYNANGEIDYTSGYGSWTEGAGYTHGNPFALEFSYMFGPHSKLGPLGVVTCMKGEKLLFSEEWLWIMVGAK